MLAQIAKNLLNNFGHETVEHIPSTIYVPLIVCQVEYWISSYFQKENPY